MKMRRGVGVALLGAGLVVLSCSADRGTVPVEARADASVSAAGARPIIDSPAAVARIADLRTRFRTELGAPVATRFEAATRDDATTHVRAVLPSEALRGVSRPARVALPLHASDEVMLEDETSHLSVRFALDHVQDARIELAGGMAVYRGALDGADVVHRVHAEGTEDFVVFETRPAREELSYSVDVSHVSGLRLVSNTLEFLDESGTPLLRVAPPYVVDAIGVRHEAKLAVGGCDYDTNPAGPWGRKLTGPGAERCSVRVTWSGDVAYPALVDPAWAATGSMAIVRQDHTAIVLLSGKVLVIGGADASAELYDPASGGGVGTFAATGSMSTARPGAAAALLPSGKVLVAGGNSMAGYLASAELYDPAGNAAAGSFAATGTMTDARQLHTASVLLSGKVLVAGGQTASGLTSAEIFDPAGNAGAGSFTATATLTQVRWQHTATVLASGKVLVAGGFAGSFPGYVASAEIFDPAGNGGAGTFTATGSLNDGRYLHTASLLASGKVIVIGGYGGGTLQLAEIFDPAGNAGKGTFGPTGLMVAARANHTASVLHSGKVIVAGGSGASTELFDPSGNGGAGTFAAAAPMATARSSHTASVLASGKVLVAGGGTTSAEVFGGTPGDPCATNAYCLSGFCADGFCCNSACSGGGCDRCDLSGKEGTCTVAPVGNPGANPACAPYACDGTSAACPTGACASDATCAASHDFCAASGTCQPQKAQGAACDAKADCKQPGCHECLSGFCVDGFCCDTACNGTCKACAAALKYSSAANGTCDTAKNGLDRGGVVCGPPAASCDGDHVTTAADGTKKDCAPYKCDSDGSCRAGCTSVADCIAPTICDGTGKCVAPAADPGSGGGCAVPSGGASDGRGLLALVAVGLGMLGVRSRPRRKSDRGADR